jgi:hypothetical protein
MSGDDDDKPTVVLDLNALKKQKLKQEEELANIVEEIEFDVLKTGKPQTKTSKAMAAESCPEESVEDIKKSAARNKSEQKGGLRVLLFDFQSDFFQKSQDFFPEGHDYKIVSTLQELNKCLASKAFQIIIFNYDANPKAVNQLTAQIKQKFPYSKTMIMAKAISPEKAKMHAKTPSGANGYYQFPLDPLKIEAEFQKIYSTLEKAV